MGTIINAAIIMMLVFVAIEMLLYIYILIEACRSSKKHLDKILNHPYVKGLIEEEKTKSNENK